MTKAIRRKPLYIKVITSILGAFIMIFIFMEIANFYTISNKREMNKNAYQQTLELHGNYWNTRFEFLNNSLLLLASPSGNNYYYDMCNTTDSLTYLQAKVMFLNEMKRIVQIYNGQFRIFFYYPEKEINLFTESTSTEWKENLQMNNALQDLIEERTIVNSSHWDLCETDYQNYFVNIYQMEKGYIGAIIDCDTILADIKNGISADANIFITDSSGKELSGKNDNIEDVLKFDLVYSPLTYTDFRLTISINQYTFFREYFSYILWLLIATVICIFLAVFTVRYQFKIIISPLNKLKTAIEQFGNEGTDYFLDENDESVEIYMLNKAFNEMTVQIKKLKIDIYESEIQNQEMKYNFLKAQVKPHFYSNCLNMMHGLAEIKDYISIQQLSLAMANYFRHLLNTDDDFILLDRELDCVNNYVNIQNMRYQGQIHYSVRREANKENFQVPPMLIQTFVENSIKHNITVVKILEITVSIQLECDKVSLQVEDNGTGFQGDVLEKIRKKQDISHKGMHIGISNIQNRLNMLFDMDYSMEIVNRNIGTVIKIVIPNVQVSKVEQEGKG